MANAMCNVSSQCSQDNKADSLDLVLRDPSDTAMTAQKGVLIVVMTTANVFMLLGNGFSVFIILRSRSLRCHTYYWLVLNLAVLDLMNSLFVVPLNIVWEYHGNWPFSQALCDIEIFCDLGFSTVAAYSTVLLSLDKYLYIARPFFYHRRVGPRATLACVLATWGVWMTYSALSVFGDLARSEKAYKYDFPLDNCNFVMTHSYGITSFVSVFFVPLVILVFSSSRILCVARHHIRDMRSTHRFSDALSTTASNAPVLSPTSGESPGLSSNDSDKYNTSSNKPSTRRTDMFSAAPNIPTQTFPVTTSPSTTRSSETSSTISQHTEGQSVANKPFAKTNKTFRAFGTVTIVVFAYIIMFAPYWIATVVHLGCACIQPRIFEDYLTVFYYMHSLVNPYIYMATDRRYKKAIRHMLARNKCWQRFRNTRVGPRIHVSSTY